MSSIVRVEHDAQNPYVMINKKSLWDPNLSLEAVGLWTRLLSRPDNWQISIPELMKSCGCGRDKIQRILNELIENGYAHRFQDKVNKEKQNQFDRVVYTIFEKKLSNEEIKIKFPQPPFPVTEVPCAENPHLLNKENILNKEKKRDRAPVETVAKIARFSNVHTTQEEHEKLVSRFGEAKVNQYYEKLHKWKNAAKPSVAKKLTDAYRTETWIEKDLENANPKNSEGYKRSGKLAIEADERAKERFKIEGGTAMTIDQFKEMLAKQNKKE